MGFRKTMMRPNMGRPDGVSALPQVREAKVLDYVKQLEAQNRLLRQGLIPNATGDQLKTNMDTALPPELRPGNLGNLGNVIWPYWFTAFSQNPAAPAIQLAPGQSATISFIVTQEAAFVMTQLAKVVHFDVGGPPVATYLDPDNFDVGVSNANDLSIVMRDASSTRDFMQNPIPLDTIGDPGNPTPFPTPMWIKENGRLEFFVANAATSTRTYWPKLIAFGYRIRTDAYEKILSGVTA